MPIFEYRCSECGFQKEVLQKINEQPLTDCPECNQSTFVKALSAPRFRLSGSGWYETDEKPKDKQRNVTDSDSTPPKTSSQGTKSETSKTDSSAADAQ